MRGILFIGGRGPTPGQLKAIVAPDDIICAADSGLDACLAASIVPNGIVGDMDSLSRRSLLDDFPAEMVEISPVDKDETDTELGLIWLERRGVKEVILVGGGEGRLDHTFALRTVFGRNFSPVLWYTAREEIRMVEHQIVLQGEIAQRFSFFPVGRGPWKIRSTGLVWELGEMDWRHDSVSLSNRLRRPRAKIEVAKGRFLVVRPLKDALLQILGRQ